MVRGISMVQNYTLLSIYVIFDILGIAVLLFAVDKLPEDMSMGKIQSKVKAYCAEPFVKLLKVLFSRNMLLLGPISLYNGMELSFAYSSFTQVESSMQGFRRISQKNAQNNTLLNFPS